MSLSENDADKVIFSFVADPLKGSLHFSAELLRHMVYLAFHLLGDHFFQRFPKKIGFPDGIVRFFILL